MEILIIIFIYGAFLGSFLNVCIYRLPQNQSIVFPNSYCPSCKTPLKIWQNIPLLSYLILRGRCFFCSVKISPRYFLVELITGILCAYFFIIFHFSFAYFYYIFFIALLIIIFYIDLEHQLILDLISYPGIILGFLGSFFMPEEFSLGGIFGGIFFYLIRVIGTFLAKEEAMGLGDVKFAILIGIFLGWQKSLVAFIFSFFLLILVSLPLLILKIKKGKDPIPFGTFMALGAFLALLFSSKLIWFYLYWPTLFFKI
ncbi:MAG: prepilin peptidase [Armatimonadetes bacterium]|nr:prepilin peptidase [Armatimonadota bacterium]